MELREFAERILFGHQLEDKLVSPSQFSDKNPHGFKLDLPDFPARPSSLSLRTEKVPPFPSLKQMEAETERGKVFHFFANHELLAMELMALALLRFPDAPPAFRLGLARTIVEEQKHFELYRARLNALGLELGDVPVNDFFWKCLAPMSDPRQYVAGMSLTFEQANLDYSLFYRDVFAQLGDRESETVMNTVYTEEIGHVKHGWMWLQKWKEQGQSAWEFYQRHIMYPLTASRAKGLGFAQEGRQLAGMETEFMDEVRLFPEAKANAARIYWYNPDCEQQIAGGNAYMPSELHRQVMDDFAVIPLYLAREGDILLGGKKPSASFLKELAELEFPKVHWVTVKQPEELQWNELLPQRVEQFLPWGWSPRAKKVADEIEKKLPKPYLAPAFTYSPELIKTVFSKHQLPALRRQIVENHGADIGLWGTEAAIGILCRTEEEILSQQKKVAGEWQQPVVLKVPFSAAGQATMRLRPDENPSHSQLGWMRNMLALHGQLLVEPWFDKVMDFSFQFMLRETPQLLGPTRFFTDIRGQYGGHVLGEPFDELDRELKKKLFRRNARGESLMSFAEKAAISAAQWLHKQGYRGPAGIDTFAYKNPEGGDDLFVQTVGEINPRFTMGHVALALSQKMNKGQPGLWISLARAGLKALGEERFDVLAGKLRQKEPLTLLESHPLPLVKSGIFFTNDPNTAQSVLGVVAVGEKACQTVRDLAKRLSSS